MHSPRAATGIVILLLLLGSSAARPGLSTAGERPSTACVALSSSSVVRVDTDDQTVSCLQVAQRTLTSSISIMAESCKVVCGLLSGMYLFSVKSKAKPAAAKMRPLTSLHR